LKTYLNAVNIFHFETTLPIASDIAGYPELFETFPNLITGHGARGFLASQTRREDARVESHVSAGGLGIGLGHLPRLPRLAAAMLAIGGHECIYHLDFVSVASPWRDD